MYVQRVLRFFVEVQNVKVRNIKRQNVDLKMYIEYVLFYIFVLWFLSLDKD
jgi:hypothetical protein